MDCEWDPAKAKANREKHGVSFADAAVALSDDFALTVPDPDSQNEARFVSLGMDPHGRLLVTVFTHRGARLRIISSRKASKGEWQHYEKGR
jgi:hypothetical protein